MLRDEFCGTVIVVPDCCGNEILPFVYEMRIFSYPGCIIGVLDGN